MSRRVRVNLVRWWCRIVGHRWGAYGYLWPFCDRCGRFW